MISRECFLNQPLHCPDVLRFTSFLEQKPLFNAANFSTSSKFANTRHIKKPKVKNLVSLSFYFIYLQPLHVTVQGREEFSRTTTGPLCLPSFAYCRWIIKKVSLLFTPFLFFTYFNDTIPLRRKFPSVLLLLLLFSLV